MDSGLFFSFTKSCLNFTKLFNISPKFENGEEKEHTPILTGILVFIPGKIMAVNKKNKKKWRETNGNPKNPPHQCIKNTLQTPSREQQQQKLEIETWLKKL